MRHAPLISAIVVVTALVFVACQSAKVAVDPGPMKPVTLAFRDLEGTRAVFLLSNHTADTVYFIGHEATTPCYYLETRRSDGTWWKPFQFWSGSFQPLEPGATIEVRAPASSFSDSARMCLDIYPDKTGPTAVRSQGYTIPDAAAATRGQK